MRILALALLLCLTRLSVPAQTELFLSTQSGSPFSISDESDAFFWNASIGVEQYMADKISISLAYRKMFDLGSLADQNPNYVSTSYIYTYSQSINSFAIDFESKYFIDAPDDGWYISSGISYQHIETDGTILSVDNNGSTPFPPLLQAGASVSNVTNIFPLSFKAGHRSSSDTFVVDYFGGVSYNMGIGNVTYQYPDIFSYNALKRLTFIIGVKAGFK